MAKVIKIKKILFIFFMLLVINAFSVFAVSQWKWEAGQGARLPGDLETGYTGFSTNQVNYAETFNYSVFLTDSSVYSPLAADLDADTFPEVIGIGSYLSAYRFDGDLISTLQLNETPNFAPIIGNANGDSYPEIYMLLDNSLVAYQYNVSTTNFDLILNFTYNTASINPVVAGGANDLLICDTPYYGNFTCLISKRSNRNTTVIDFGNSGTNNSYYQTGAYRYFRLNNAFPADSLFTFSIPNGLGSAQQIDTGNYFPFTPICLGSQSTALNLYCYLVSVVDGGVTFSQNTIGASSAVTAIYYDSAFIAKMGTTRRIFVNIESLKSVVQHRYSVFDMSMNWIFNATTGANPTVKNTSSNWMVGLFGKGSVTYACLLQQDSNNTDVWLKCWTSTFTSIVKFNVSGVMSVNKGYVMADFDPTSAYLSFADPQGIYSFNGSAWRQIFYNTATYGIADSFDTNRSGIVVNMPSTGSPLYYFADSTKGFIYSNIPSLSSCGDGICQPTENEFTCPIDCSQQTACALLNISGHLIECREFSSGTGLCSADDRFYCIAGNLITYVVDSDPTHTAYLCNQNNENFEATFVACPNGCFNGNCLNVLCNAGFEVCSNGIDFAHKYSSGDVYKCFSNGTGWGLIDQCTGENSTCNELGPTHAQCQTFLNYSCLQDSNCAPEYPYCLCGTCTAGVTNQTCIRNSDCNQVSAPVCQCGHCVSGVLGNVTNAGNGANQVPPANPDDFWNIIFQGSSIWRAFISLFVLIYVCVLIDANYNIRANHMVTVLIWGIGLTAFLVTNLIYSWVGFFLILIVGSLFLLTSMLKSKQTEG